MPSSSIFEFADKFGVESPFETNAVDAFPFAASPTASDRTDYIPLVSINYGGILEDTSAINALIAPPNTPGFSTAVQLERSFDRDNRTYHAPAIVIAKSSVALIPLRIDLGYDPIGFQDGDGILSFKCSEGDVKMEFFDESVPKNVNSKSSRYDVRKTGVGDKFVLAISHKLARGTKFTITITATDDKGTFETHSSKQVRCGVLMLQVLEKDVFFTEQVIDAENEFLFMKDFINGIPIQERTPAEYQTNYCMQGAERALSEMLQNHKDFYSVDRNNKRRSHIPLTGLTAENRGDVFTKLGYAQRKFEYNKYGIVFNELYKLVDAPKTAWPEVRYNAIKVMDEKPLIAYFKTTALQKMGHHVYYFSLSDNYHTLILFLDNTNPNKPLYEIWDDDAGKSSSAGAFEDIADGFRKQTSWTFASNFLAMGHKKGLYPKTITRLWKIQRK